MQPDEIKQRLSARRPHSDDQNQAELTAAWDAAQKDPSLREWITQEEDFDTTVAEALAEGIAVPADLRERLLSQAANTRSEPADTPLQPAVALTTASDTGKANGKRRSGAGRLLWYSLQHPYAFYGAVACLALALTITFLADPFSSDEDPDSHLPKAYDRLISHYTVPSTPRYLATDMEQIRSILRAQNAPTPGVVPKQVEDMTKVGCEVFQVDGQPVSLIRLQQKDKSLPHYLYVFSRHSSAPDEVEAFEKEQAQQHRGYTLKSWSGPQNLYLLASPEETTPE